MGTSLSLAVALAAWHERRERFEEAYAVYGKYENKADGLSRIASSYPSRPNVFVDMQARDVRCARRSPPPPQRNAIRRQLTSTGDPAI